MWRRLLLIVLPVVVVSAVGAHAASSGSDRARGSQYTLPEPAITASSSLRLPALGRCVRRSFVRVGLIPPGGVTFASLSVRVGVREVLQLASLGGPGTVVVSLPKGRSRVRVTGTTSGGQFISAAQTYRRCAKKATPRTPATTPTAPKPKPNPKPKPKPTPVVQGGGED